MYHHLATLILEGNLTTGPIGECPQRILDVGCGTGIWSIDAGKIIPFEGSSKGELAVLTNHSSDEWSSPKC